jgi:hypothetical protein
METSNLSLSQSNEYHHPDSRMGKKEANKTSNLSLSQSNEYNHPDSRMGKKEANCHNNFVVEGLTTLPLK